ncbi:MAG: LysM peptidoglycan-binding domain-containing protein, partial [Patescibacteria group bacterium]
IFILFGQSSSSSSSSSSSTSSSASAPSCGDTSPGAKAPWLYGAIAQDSGSALLYFTEADNPVDKYVLQFGTKSGNYPWGSTNIGGKGTRTYLVQSLSSNTTYYFRVRAGNGCATGSWSNELSVKTYEFTPSIHLVANTFELKPVSCSSQYTIKKGDTLWDIAQQFLGNGSKYKEILQVNKKLGDGTQLAVGQELQVPCPSSDSSTPPVSEEKGDRQLTVKVTDEDKKPVAGAKVTLHSKPREAITDQTGKAVFAGIEPGNHRLVIAYKNYTGEQSLNLAGDTKEFNLNIQVQPKNILFSPQVIAIIGVMALVILVLVVLLIKSMVKKT